MSRFQVQAVWLVDGPKVMRGDGVLSGSWPKGLLLSRFDGTALTVLAEVRARTADDARDLVAGRVVLAWQARCGGALGAPDRVRVTRRDPRDKVAAGAAGRRERLAATFAALRRDPVPLWHPDDAPPVRLADGLWLSGPDAPDDGPEDGGLAGVREPRRPGPGPGHLSAAAQPPPVTARTRSFGGVHEA